MPQDITVNLIRAGTLEAFGERRKVLWQLNNIDHQDHYREALRAANVLSI